MPRRAAFTLVELLVVIGIIAVLIGILLPTLSKARASANTLKCLAQLRDVGQGMAIYSNTYGGYLFPTDAGGPTGPVAVDKQWYVYVLNVKGPIAQADFASEAKWIPATLRCPSDILDGVTPGSNHSYLLNDHLNARRIKYSSRLPNGLTPSSTYVMGEKKTSQPDFYIQPFPPGDRSDYYTGVLEFKRHGRPGSNYLFLDLHAATQTEPTFRDPTKQLDPWDPGSPTPEGRNLKWPWWEQK